MSTELVVHVLTVLAAVVIVLTRLRLRRDAAGGGRVEIARGPVDVHTVSGGLALLTWTAFLALGDRIDENAATLLGLAALTLWVVVAIAGLLILARWLPARGRHAAPGADDTWTDGPGLSLLGHVGMVLGVLVFTYAYLVKAV